MTVKVVLSHLDYTEPYVVRPDPRFNSLCLTHSDWFNDPLVEQMVLDIDKTIHIKDFIFDSSVLGGIPPQLLSGGFKGLVLILKDLRGCRVFASRMFGDNCVEWLRKLSFEVDFTLLMCHPLGWSRAYVDTSWSREPLSRGPHPICAITEDGVPLNDTDDITLYYSKRYVELWDKSKDEYLPDEEDDLEWVRQKRKELGFDV